MLSQTVANTTNMSLACHYLQYHSQLSLAPLIVLHHPYGTIKNSYIIMLKLDVSSSVFQNHIKFLTSAYEFDPLQLDGDVKSGIRHLFNIGYTGMFIDSVIDKIR